MSKNTNLSFLTDYITADITNGRIGINNASPTVAFDVVGVAKFSSSVTSGGELTTTSGLLSISGGGGAPPTGGVGFRTVAGRLIVYGGTSDITFQKNSNSGPNLTILESGAATFSSSVTVTGNNAYVINSAGATTGYIAGILSNTGGNIQFGVAASNGSFWGTGDGGAYYGTFGTGTNTDLVFATNSAGRMKISNSGVVTINNLGSGAVTATSGVLSTTSDMTLKIEDGYIDNALEKISQLKPRYFYWKEESGLPTDIRQLGFYAQEVNQALGEEAANTPKNENDKWGIYDRGIIAMLTKGIQELSAEINLLKQK
jgi:hypothetical protein